MHTRPPIITIDVNENKAGNLLTLSAAVHRDLDPTDSVSSIKLMDDIPGVVAEVVSMAIPGSTEFQQPMCQQLLLMGTKGKKLIIDYNTQTGDYEISINDFGITEISTLRIAVNRINMNRMPRPTLTV
jgi:hypothetical protein